MLIEIRFHGRGGQGVVTAAELLASAAGLDGLWSSAFPIYGAERRGAPIEAYCRISKESIRITSPVENPDFVVVIDPTLLQIVNLLRGLKPGGVIVVNSKNTTLENSYYLDATSLAKEIGLVKSGWPMTNLIMLGALIRVMGVVSMDSLIKAIREEFNGKVAELNVQGVKLAYERVKGAVKIAA
nr:2-oxoacid:acceptor oxidoreductase family protein [Acidianus sp. RZ1]